LKPGVNDPDFEDPFCGRESLDARAEFGLRDTQQGPLSVQRGRGVHWKGGWLFFIFIRRHDDMFVRTSVVSMLILTAISYRGDQVDRYTAMTFMTFLSNWNEKLNFYAGDWNGKHNNGVATFMPHLLLDQPYMRASTVYNWRYRPMIFRDKLGRVTVKKVIYNTEGFPFSG